MASSVLSSPTYCVKVHNSEFHINAKVLTSTSPYFAALLNGGFAEDQTQTVILTSAVDTSAPFSAIVEYMYDGDYAKSSLDQSYGHRPSSLTAPLLHTNVIIMANRLCMPELEELGLKKLAAAMEYCDSLNPTGLFWMKTNFLALIRAVCSHTPEKDEVDEKPAVTGETTNMGPSLQSKPATNPSTNEQKITKPSDDTNIPQQKPKQPKCTDGLRTLVATFCAYKLDHIREEAKFKQLVRKFPEFAEDVLMAVGKGSGFKETLSGMGQEASKG